jgi:hypothetical protein
MTLALARRVRSACHHPATGRSPNACPPGGSPNYGILTLIVATGMRRSFSSAPRRCFFHLPQVTTTCWLGPETGPGFSAPARRPFATLVRALFRSAGDMFKLLRCTCDQTALRSAFETLDLSPLMPGRVSGPRRTRGSSPLLTPSGGDAQRSCWNRGTQLIGRGPGRVHNGLLIREIWCCILEAVLIQSHRRGSLKTGCLNIGFSRLVLRVRQVQYGDNVRRGQVRLSKSISSRARGGPDASRHVIGDPTSAGFITSCSRCWTNSDDEHLAASASGSM